MVPKNAMKATTKKDTANIRSIESNVGPITSPANTNVPENRANPDTHIHPLRQRKAMTVEPLKISAIPKSRRMKGSAEVKLNWLKIKNAPTTKPSTPTTKSNLVFETIFTPDHYLCQPLGYAPILMWMMLREI